MCSKVETLCGILGIWAKNKNGESELEKTSRAIQHSQHRGPDFQDVITDSNVSLAHSRLSIIDTSAAANQPFTDQSGRYTLVYNGEIYNYKSLRDKLKSEGQEFKTDSDTEVLLYHLIKHGKKGLNDLNGCFAFLFFDREQQELTFARDRFGINPLIIYEDEDKFIFTSELNTLFDFNIDKSLDNQAINHYFRLTYIPAPRTILKNAFKVLPGQVGTVNSEGVQFEQYYKVERKPFYRSGFDQAKTDLKDILNQSVEKRLVADVPLGTFLSGGVDSSIISFLAKEHKADLKTFSIGFEHSYFDESTYARKVAKHIESDHHEFIIGKKDFQHSFLDFLNAIDEPFADSSAFAVYFLSQKTSQEVKVALSGDGADELFAGYRKHLAEYKLRRFSGAKKTAIKAVANILGGGKVNRSDFFGDFNRRLQKVNDGLKMNKENRFWEWCCFSSTAEVNQLLKSSVRMPTKWKGGALDEINDLLIADQCLVLPNDMLKKVDLMSMANSLEVRTPFLDHEVVEFSNSLPLEYKLNAKGGKLILKAAFQEDLPQEIFNRSKKGFEIPIKEWLFDEIQELLSSPLFSEDFIEEQGIFNYNYMNDLMKNFSSKQFGDRIYMVWALVVFQHWYKRFYE